MFVHGVPEEMLFPQNARYTYGMRLRDIYLIEQRERIYSTSMLILYF